MAGLLGVVPHGRRTLGWMFGLAVAGVVVVGTTLALSAQPTLGIDTAGIRQGVLDAITVDNQLTMLPAGVKPGGVSAAARATWRNTMRNEVAAHFGGTALTNRLNGLLTWSDRLAAQNSTEGYLISFSIRNLSIDDPSMADNVATVSGTVSIVEKQGFMTSSGQEKTYGGTYTLSFTFQMEQRGNKWVVIDLSEAPVGFEPDPAMDNGVQPSPNSTKYIPPSYAPVPYNPANP